jgi:uncharacterized repeat protein (TIGR04138 family)
MQWYRQELEPEYQAVADSLEVSPSAVQFVLDLVVAALYYHDDGPRPVEDYRRDCNASDVCHAAPLFASDLFEDHASDFLLDVGLRTGADLGRIVYALVDAGLLLADENDRRDAFSADIKLV